MRTSILSVVCIVCLFFLSSFLPKDKVVPGFDYREMGYSQPTAFIYHVVHKTQYATWEDSAGLFCSDNVFNSAPGMTTTEWTFLAGDSTGAFWVDRSKQSRHSFTEGTATRDTFLFMHPARACYGELQCCPYPYFENKAEWTWDFEVGEAWNVGPLFPIKGKERFYMNYKWVEGRKAFETPMGPLSCARVDATCRSTFGVSTATYYLHETYGLVHFSVSALDKEFFEFSLIKKVNGRKEMSKIYHHFAYGWSAPDIRRQLEQVLGTK
ncbi:MAG TPA: hypothetical protein VEB40_09850 [Flavipsychrobacter sp.]|nr:hypothetical protein [Flavipsychrobacter sp.]